MPHPQILPPSPNAKEPPSDPGAHGVTAKSGFNVLLDLIPDLSKVLAGEEDWCFIASNWKKYAVDAATGALYGYLIFTNPGAAVTAGFVSNFLNDAGKQMVDPDLSGWNPMQSLFSGAVGAALGKFSKGPASWNFKVGSKPVSDWAARKVVNQGITKNVPVGQAMKVAHGIAIQSGFYFRSLPTLTTTSLDSWLGYTQNMNDMFPRIHP